MLGVGSVSRALSGRIVSMGLGSETHAWMLLSAWAGARLLMGWEYDDLNARLNKGGTGGAHVLKWTRGLGGLVWWHRGIGSDLLEGY